MEIEKQLKKKRNFFTNSDELCRASRITQVGIQIFRAYVLHWRKKGWKFKEAEQ